MAMIPKVVVSQQGPCAIGLPYYAGVSGQSTLYMVLIGYFQLYYKLRHIIHGFQISEY